MGSLLLFLFLAIVWAIGFGALTGWLADQKGRDPQVWFILGALFGFFALFAVGLAPAADAATGPNRFRGNRSRLSESERRLSAFSPTCRVCGEPALGGTELCSDHQSKNPAPAPTSHTPRWPD
jgi:MFS family permease